MSPPLLEIGGLSVRQGAALVLTDVALAVARGEVVALLGPNGAGKSTLLRAIMGFARPAGGRIAFDGRAIAALGVAARARLGIGYSPEGRRVFPGLTVRETLVAASRRPGADMAADLRRMYALFPSLARAEHSLAWQLSGGQQQMLAIARALMGAPRLLLLDEPTLGLAPRLAADVLAQVRTIAAGGAAVLLAEQNVPGALGVAGRGYVMAGGRVVASGPSADLRHEPRLEAAFLGG